MSVVYLKPRTGRLGGDLLRGRIKTRILSQSRQNHNHNEKGYNEIVIKDGEVYMRKADCENQICVKTPSIKYTGQRIVCALTAL